MEALSLLIFLLNLATYVCHLSWSLLLLAEPDRISFSAASNMIRIFSKLRSKVSRSTSDAFCSMSEHIFWLIRLLLIWIPLCPGFSHHIFGHHPVWIYIAWRIPFALVATYVSSLVIALLVNVFPLPNVALRSAHTNLKRLEKALTMLLLAKKAYSDDNNGTNMKLAWATIASIEFMHTHTNLQDCIRSEEEASSNPGGNAMAVQGQGHPRPHRVGQAFGRIVETIENALFGINATRLGWRAQCI
jgi:hypothetical protein